jgi:hypothetical protein
VDSYLVVVEFNGPQGIHDAVPVEAVEPQTSFTVGREGLESLPDLGVLLNPSRRLSARASLDEDDGYEERSLAYQLVLSELIEAQRGAIIQLRNEGAISNDVMHRIERDLDLEDSRLEI